MNKVARTGDVADDIRRIITSINQSEAVLAFSACGTEVTDGGGGGGGAGTVTSVAGGVGITNSPEPITGAGTVDLDVNSLTTETVLATGDLLPFLDVSVGVTPAAQRKITVASLLAGLQSLGGLVDGAGVVGQVAFWADANTLTGENALFWDAALDRLGIGTATPGTQLHVQREAGSTSFRTTTYDNSANPQWSTERARGTIALPTGVLAGTTLSQWLFRGQFSTTPGDFANGAGLTIESTETWSSIARGTLWRWFNVVAGTTTFAEFMRFADDNSVLIGTTVKAGGKLVVAGHVSLNSAGAASELRLYEPTGGPEYSSFKSPALAATLNYTLPPTLLAGSVLTDVAGNGTLTWAVPAGGGTVTGTGAAGQVATWTSASAITGENALFWDATNNRLGINTITPANPLEVVGESTSAAVVSTRYDAVAASSGSLTARRARGTLAIPATLAALDSVGKIIFQGHDATSFTTQGQLEVLATEAWTLVPPAKGTRLVFSTTPNGSATLTERVSIGQDGRVAIGTTTPLQMLDVVGVDTGTSSIEAACYNDTVVSARGRLLLSRSRGTEAIPSPVAVNDRLGSIAFQGHDGGGFGNPGVDLISFAAEAFSTGHGARLEFHTCLIGATLGALRMTLHDDGELCLNTPTKTGAKLTVAGRIQTSNIFQSTIATGTAPLTVASTTLVANLNADLLDGLDSTAFQLADADLTALAALATFGIVTRTGAATFATRTIVAGGSAINVTDGDGVLGNPTVNVDADLAEIASIANVRGDLIITGVGVSWERLAIGAANRVLRSNGTDPSWAQVALGTDVTGTLPIANGGTGQTTALAAFNALSPLTTRGDLLTRNATDNARLAVGTTGRFLRSDGTDPSWQLLVEGDLPNLTSAQWIAHTTDETGTGLLVFNNSPTIVTPTIASFTNAQHTHQNAAGGGQLDHGLALTAASLLDDDHVGYTRLLGRAGVTNDTTLSTTVSGTLYGSNQASTVAAPCDLNLEATLHPNKGQVNVKAPTLVHSVVRTGTGTLSSVGVAVAGAGTAFQDEMAIGDTITADGYSRHVVTLPTQTSLTVDRQWPVDLVAGAAFTYQRPILKFQSVAGTTRGFLTPDDYFVVGASLINATNQANLSVTGTQPASSSSTGSEAPRVMFVQGAKGGNTTGTAGELAGSGGRFNLAAGAGGDASGTAGNSAAGGSWTASAGAGGVVSAAGGGAAGSGGTILFSAGVGGALTGAASGSIAGSGGLVTFTAGNGGTAVAGNTRGNGGVLTLRPGLAGTGAGTGGINGFVKIADLGGNCVIGSAVDNGERLGVAGDFAMRAADLPLVNGNNDNIAIGSRSFIRITGPTAAFVIRGIANGTDGKLLIIENTVNFTMSFNNDDAGSTAANRIYLGSGAGPLVLAAGAGATDKARAVFIYDATLTRWILLSARDAAGPR